MTTITLSSLPVNRFHLWMKVAQNANASPIGGSEQVVDLLNDRWLATLTLPPRLPDEGAEVEALLGQLRGQVNKLALWHLQRPQPRGTMRGSPTLSGAHSRGAASLQIANAGAGATLLRGDMLGASDLLLMVAEDCTADGSGNIVVPITNRLRKALTDTTAIVWDKPTAPFRRIGTGSVEYIPGQVEPLTLDFVEAVES